MMRGHTEAAWTCLEHGQRREALSGRYARLSRGHTYETYFGPIHAMRGRATAADKALESYRALIVDTPTDRFRWAQYLAQKILSLVEVDGDSDRIDAAIADHKSFALRPNKIPLHLRHAYVAIAYARLGQLKQAMMEKSDSSVRQRQVGEAIRDLKRAAKHPTLRAHRRVAEAIQNEILGKVDAAERDLHEAEALAERTKNVWVAFEALLVRAAIAERRAQPRDADSCLRSARQLAIHHRWPCRLRRCETISEHVLSMRKLKS